MMTQTPTVPLATREELSKHEVFQNFDFDRFYIAVDGARPLELFTVADDEFVFSAMTWAEFLEKLRAL